MKNVYYKLYYHIIWGTKNRLELIDNNINEKLISLIEEKNKQLGGHLIIFNSYLDHCHLLISIPPKISISKFVGELKGFSSFGLNKYNEAMKWQNGFGAISISEKDLERVKRYIKNQKTHHESKNISQSLESLQ